MAIDTNVHKSQMEEEVLAKPDVARAPSPLQQGRGGLATSCTHGFAIAIEICIGGNCEQLRFVNNTNPFLLSPLGVLEFGRFRDSKTPSSESNEREIAPLWKLKADNSRMYQCPNAILSECHNDRQDRRQRTKDKGSG